MNKFAQNKPDYLFIVSLVIIIFVAVYLAMDRFKDSQISDFLSQKGQELLAHIDNQQERENLRSEYNAFVKKVADQDVDPEKVERFVSSMINLNQAREKLKKDEFANIFQINLQTAIKEDTVKRSYKNDQQWQKLQERLKDIIVFEEKLKEVDLKKTKLEKTFTFSYSIDDTLNIIINEELKENLAKQAELSRELERLEKEKALKWQKETTAIKENENSLQEALQALEKVEAAVSAIAITNDSAKISVSTKSVPDETPESPQTSAAADN